VFLFNPIKIFHILPRLLITKKGSTFDGIMNNVIKCGGVPLISTTHYLVTVSRGERSLINKEGLGLAPGPRVPSCARVAAGEY